MCEEAKTVEWIDSHEGQPKVESEACQGCEIDPFAPICFLVGPTEEGREEGHEEDEAIQAENDDQHLWIVSDEVTEASGARLGQVCREDIHLCE